MGLPGAILDPSGLSISCGIALADEPGIGSLTLPGWFREVTRRYGPSEAAVIHIDGKVERWTYAELYARALRVAKSLKACGVGKGDRVGVLATNRLEFLAAFFGASLAGAVGATISTFFTASELETVIKMGAPSVLLVERNVLKKDFAQMLTEVEPALLTAEPGAIASVKFPFLRHVALIDSDEGTGAIEGWSTFLSRGDAVDEALVDASGEAVEPADPGVLFFSSGSTGKAKGILSAHRGVCLQLWRWTQWYDLKTPPRTWSANGFFWSGNFAMALGGTLSSGGSLLLQRWFDGPDALRLLEAEKGTMVLAWPHQWQQLIEAPNYASANLSSLYYIDKDTPLAQHPSVKTDWKEPFHAYGNTETFTLISVFPANSPAELADGTHGLPTAGSTIKIIDPMTGVTTPLGERGEIAVKGPTLMLGYVGIPLADSTDEEGFLRTGDGGYLDAKGRLVWEGRLNDIIKTGGANVSPIEIDDHLRDCPGVKIAKTVGVPDELLGELVVTCVVLHDGASVSESDVQAYAKKQLASYKIPRRVLFFAEDELETTGSAKIKTADLKKLAIARLAAEA